MRSIRQAFPFALSHELVIFGTAGTRRRIWRHAAGPRRDGIAQSGRKLLVDGSTAAQAAHQESAGKNNRNVAGTDRHLPNVATLRDEVFAPGTRPLARRNSPSMALMRTSVYLSKPKIAFIEIAGT
jgi:hypothetical protein